MQKTFQAMTVIGLALLVPIAASAQEQAQEQKQAEGEVRDAQAVQQSLQETRQALQAIREHARLGLEQALRATEQALEQIRNSARQALRSHGRRVHQDLEQVRNAFEGIQQQAAAAIEEGRTAIEQQDEAQMRQALQTVQSTLEDIRQRAQGPLAAAAATGESGGKPAETADRDQGDARVAKAESEADAGSSARTQGALTDLIGKPVRTEGGDQIGEVDNLVLDTNAGRIEQVIVGFGGFLGLGEKEVAIPWSEVVPSSGNEGIVIRMTEADVEAAPEFDAESLSQGQALAD